MVRSLDVSTAAASVSVSVSAGGLAAADDNEEVTQFQESPVAMVGTGLCV